MGKSKVWVYPAAARQIRNSPEMQALLLGKAEAISAAASAGLPAGSEGFAAEVAPGKGRARASVRTTDFLSIRHNSKNNALLKALGGAG